MATLTTILTWIGFYILGAIAVPVVIGLAILWAKFIERTEFEISTIEIGILTYRHVVYFTLFAFCLTSFVSNTFSDGLNVFQSGLAIYRYGTSRLCWTRKANSK